MVESKSYKTLLDMMDARQDELIRQMASYNELDPKVESDDICRGRYRELSWLVIELSRVKEELAKRIEEGGNTPQDLDNHNGSQ
jgi:hypothetical protein